MGGLAVSQQLTLYNTPVLYLDRFGQWALRKRTQLAPRLLRASAGTCSIAPEPAALTLLTICPESIR